MTLRPCREESVNFDTTQNLYIEGDNLEVLKIIRETYLNKVKMIYIDPPYNTGNDFIYNDILKKTKSEYISNSGQTDINGNQLVQNTEANGRFHTDWLNMMYSRLKVSHELLSDNGVIFISVNDIELCNLIKICNEIFGESNFLVNLIWINGRTSSSHFTHAHEYIVSYAKNIKSLPLFKINTNNEIISDRAIKKTSSKNPESIITFPAGLDFESEDKIFPSIVGNSEKMEIIEGTLQCKNRKLLNTVKIKASWSMSDMIKRWLNGETVYDQKNQRITRFFFKDNGILQYEKIKGTIHPNSVIYNISTKAGSYEVDSLVGKNVFSYPKPVHLIEQLMLMTEENDIILDFFSGSATTAHAVMNLNSEDNKNRKYIMIQLPEPCKSNSEAYKLGYKNICEIGKARIRAAGKSISLKPINNQKKLVDIGFRVLKLDSSNMEDIFYTPNEFRQDRLFSDNVKNDRSQEDLLFQVMLNLGPKFRGKCINRIPRDRRSPQALSSALAAVSAV